MSTRKDRPAERWAAVDGYLRLNFPHAASWWSDSNSFSELRVKSRDDGTVLAIAKGFGDDGAPVVCFGVGYDLVTAIMAIDATIQGGRWKKDTPWPGPKK